MRAVIGVLLVCILAVACSTLSGRMQSWVGKHRDELVRVWGPPSQETTLGDGGSSLVYIQQRGSVYQGTGFARTCRMVFSTNSAGIVTSWSYYGC